MNQPTRKFLGAIVFVLDRLQDLVAILALCVVFAAVSVGRAWRRMCLHVIWGGDSMARARDEFHGR